MADGLLTPEGTAESLRALGWGCTCCGGRPGSWLRALKDRCLLFEECVGPQAAAVPVKSAGVGLHLLWRPLWKLAAGSGGAGPSLRGMRGSAGHSCACQSAGIGPPLLWRLPRRSAAGEAALKGLDGMWTRPRGLAAEWLCCLRVSVKQKCQSLEAANIWHKRGVCTPFLLVC